MTNELIDKRKLIMPIRYVILIIAIFYINKKYNVK